MTYLTSVFSVYTKLETLSGGTKVLPSFFPLGMVFLAFSPSPLAYRFISSTIVTGFAVISTHAGTKPLLMAFLTDLTLDHAVQ